MIFVAILAGGLGTRMGNLEKPKQFLKLKNKPIIIHTIEKFLLLDEFEKIIVLVPKKWINYTKDIINNYGLSNDKIVVISGGKLRNDTIMNGINYIYKNYKVSDEDFIITHDSVRPFITYRIIKENIDAMKENIACDTVIPATDTIVESKDGNIISTIPKRSNMYMGQTPQTFRINKFKKYYNELTDEEKLTLTDAAKIFIMKNEKVSLIKGETTNIKITYTPDLKIANNIINK
ncbi:MAG: 2-C-methyl-D-erythritol 4-phosphate cytidylyltransferase [Methanobrevibacter wolinii]|nr:2-C-methyl-D-erythritol 4-phosphate cytidylyltransferase [Methanobrevibacter wolinii]